MVSVGDLTLRLERATSSVTLSLQAPDRDVVWLRLRGLYGTQASTTADRLTVPLDTFLALTGALRTICSRYRLRIRPDEQLRAVLTGLAALGDQLDEAYGPTSLASATEVAGRLAGGRFARELRDFQVRDVGKLLALSHGANFSVPGAGKTTVTFGVYEAERLAGRVQSLLVVGPISSFDAWVSEANECYPQPPTIEIFEDEISLQAEVVLINYQRLATDRAYQAVSRWVGGQATQVVLDEAHRVKRGWEGKWGRACLNLAFVAERRDVLTGTPAPHSPEDLLALLDFLWPTVGRRLVPPRRELRSAAPEVVTGVSEAIRPLFVRTRKAELGLRPPEFRAVKVPLVGLQRDVYHAIRNQYAGVFEMGRADQASLARMGRIVMYLIEAATNPALLVAGSSPLDPVVFRHPPLPLPEQGHLVDLLTSFGSYETPQKFEVLANLVHTNVTAGRKTLIWTNFVRNIATLERLLRKLNPAVIHGGIPVEARRGERDRAGELRRFRNDDACLVMIANPAAAGEGISLHQVCHDAIYLDRTFNAGQYLQSVDRIHRLGLGPDVETRITLLMTENTIDEVIDERVRAKAERLGMMLEDDDIATMALPDEEEYGVPVEDVRDISAVLSHLRGTEPDQP